MIAIFEPNNLFIDTRFKEERIWYFVTDTKRFKKKAKLIQIEERYELVVTLGAQSPSEFEQYFEYITTSSSDSRITLFHCQGFADFNIFFKRIKIIPLLTTHQILSSDAIKMETNNIKGRIAGIENFFEENLIKFDDILREFTNKQDVIANIELSNNTTAILHLEFDNSSTEQMFQASQRSSLELSFKKNIPIFAAIDLFKKLEELFNFNYLFFDNENRFQSRVEGNKSRKKYYPLLKITKQSYSNQSASQSKSTYLALFHYSQIENIDHVIASWVSQYDEITRIWNPLKNVMSRSYSIDDEFLILVNTIESLHRHAYESTIQEDITRNNLRIKKIVDQIADKNDKRLVKAKLKFAYEPNLADRIAEINSLAINLGAAGFDREKVDIIAKTRNELTHRCFANDTAVSLTLAEMKNINLTMRLHLTIVILIKMRITPKKIREIVLTSNRFKID